MNKILFVGQCKQGSNSLMRLLIGKEGLTVGHDVRAMVRSVNNGTPYMNNWKDIDLSDSRYLIDKSIINPKFYDYHIEDWENYNHKMIYMIRNIYKAVRSQFLVVLAGEESYEQCIPKGATNWNVENLNEESVRNIMDYNKQKYTHYQNIIDLPADVFKLGENLRFFTFEDFIDTPRIQFDKLEEFLDIKIDEDIYPKENATLTDWYAGKEHIFKRNEDLFDKWKDFIYDYCIKYEEWSKLCDLTGFDLLTRYDIKK
jgi:hypothetical protein